MMEDFQLDGTRSENIVEDSLFGADGDTETEDMVSLRSGVSVEYLTDLKDRMKSEIDAQGSPQIYLNGNFWFRPRDAVFTLEAARLSVSGISPRELYYRDVFVWLLGLPIRLLGEPATLICPTSGCSGKLHHKSEFHHIVMLLNSLSC
jgi:hypothetical protein